VSAFDRLGKVSYSTLSTVTDALFHIDFSAWSTNIFNVTAECPAAALHFKLISYFYWSLQSLYAV